MLNVDDVGNGRGYERNVQIPARDNRDAEQVSGVMNELLDVQILGLNDDAADTLETGGDPTDLSRREEPIEIHEQVYVQMES